MSVTATVVTRKRIPRAGHVGVRGSNTGHMVFGICEPKATQPEKPAIDLAILAKGLPPIAQEQLPSTRTVESAKEHSNRSGSSGSSNVSHCPICAECYDEDGTCVTTGCNHQFHAACIAEWRCTCEGQFKVFRCPVCRTPLTNAFDKNSESHPMPEGWPLEGQYIYSRGGAPFGMYGIYGARSERTSRPNMRTRISDGILNCLVGPIFVSYGNGLLA